MALLPQHPNRLMGRNMKERLWKEYQVEIGDQNLHLSIESGVDTDNEFFAFCHDTVEMIRVNGWLIENIEEIERETI